MNTLTLLQRVMQARTEARTEATKEGARHGERFITSGGWYMSEDQDNNTLMDFSGVPTLKEIKHWFLKCQEDHPKITVQGYYEASETMGNVDAWGNRGDISTRIYWDVKLKACDF
tara:strand:- start:71 stop:415 length:345 start_codon:yes stop_codon:yes gene_type:complete